jgi:hypothetical protein
MRFPDIKVIIYPNRIEIRGAIPPQVIEDTKKMVALVRRLPVLLSRLERGRKTPGDTSPYTLAFSLFAGGTVRHG